MEREPTVAVIMPVYNYGKYLPDALESVFGQTRQADELVVIDDFSDEDIESIVSDCWERRKGKPMPKSLTFYRNYRNGGLAKARNLGVTFAQTDYCMSFDADDLMRPGAIEEHMRLAAPNTVVTMPLIAFGSESYTAYPEKGSWDILKERNCIYSNSLFPKELWKRVGGFDESETMRLGLEDWEFWQRCARAGAEFVTGTYPSLLWRRHPRSMSSTSANPNWDRITAYMRKKNG